MDRLLICLTLVLICFGISMVYDASYAFSIDHFHGDSFFYVKRQAAWTAIGLAFLFTTWRIPYWRWRPYAFYGVAMSILLLMIVLKFGHSIGGASRWLGYGPVQFQPSEIAKLALVMYLAHVTAARAKYMTDFKKGLRAPLFVILVMAVLIAREPDLGTAIVLAGTGLIVLCLAGARGRHIGYVLAPLTIVGVLYSVSKPYRLQRLTAFLNPRADQYHSGYQVWHALIALGSGGATGIGLGEGREKLYLPMANTDFIFPVIGEEWGLIGSLVLISVFVLLAFKGFDIAYRSRHAYGGLLAAGITTLITLQALLNMAVATSSVPNTGVPLPFISYGGSSLVLMMACAGLLLNISSNPDGPQPPAERAEQRWP
jgi:cell division protein FtsW